MMSTAPSISMNSPATSSYRGSGTPGSRCLPDVGRVQCSCTTSEMNSTERGPSGARWWGRHAVDANERRGRRSSPSCGVWTCPNMHAESRGGVGSMHRRGHAPDHRRHLRLLTSVPGSIFMGQVARSPDHERKPCAAGRGWLRARPRRRRRRCRHRWR